MRLVVFFTRGMSLKGWERAGILNRELAMYRGLLPHLESLAFVTYGGRDELDLASHLPGVQVLPNRWGIPANLYSVLAPFLHRRALRLATIFKTNQINGAWSAVIAKFLFGKKLVIRCGYLWSDFVARQHPNNWRHAAAERLERRALRSADAVIVAAEADRITVVERYGLDMGRVQVNPNYVDTDAFRPMPEIAREPGRVTFVGRFVDQKNVMALIEAVDGLPGIKLSLVGDGPLREELQASAKRRHIDATFPGRLQQAELPMLLNRSVAFVMPSHYEGNPKALLEAMACGVPVIGARVPGIQEILVHRETGYLCGPSAGEIRAALQEVLGDSALRERMAAGALAYAREWCPVQSAVVRELTLLRSL
jgi:glycosyltransferase involved in cell wall biosynthesis